MSSKLYMPRGPMAWRAPEQESRKSGSGNRVTAPRAGSWPTLPKARGVSRDFPQRNRVATFRALQREEMYFSRRMWRIDSPASLSAAKVASTMSGLPHR